MVVLTVRGSGLGARACCEPRCSDVQHSPTLQSFVRGTSPEPRVTTVPLWHRDPLVGFERRERLALIGVGKQFLDGSNVVSVLQQVSGNVGSHAVGQYHYYLGLLYRPSPFAGDKESAPWRQHHRSEPSTSAAS